MDQHRSFVATSWHNRSVSRSVLADAIAALGAHAWAIVALFVVPLAELCDPRVAFTFALAATGRALLELKEGDSK